MPKGGKFNSISIDANLISITRAIISINSYYKCLIKNYQKVIPHITANSQSIIYRVVITVPSTVKITLSKNIFWEFDISKKYWSVFRDHPTWTKNVDSSPNILVLKLEQL